MDDTKRHKILSRVLWGIGGAVALLLVFGLGVVIGSHRSFFASRFEENYYHNFLGEREFNTHGVAGKVIDVSTTTIAVKDAHGSEASVDITPETIVSKNNGAISSSAIVAGNTVIVIGHPMDDGNIEAGFIRVFSSSSFVPPPPLP